MTSLGATLREAVQFPMQLRCFTECLHIECSHLAVLSLEQVATMLPVGHGRMEPVNDGHLAVWPSRLKLQTPEERSHILQFIMMRLAIKCACLQATGVSCNAFEAAKPLIIPDGRSAVFGAIVAVQAFSCCQ